MIDCFTLFGERCSGTNWVRSLIETTTRLPFTWRYGWKHFPVACGFSGSEGCLFVCVFRNPYDWLGSLFKSPHHVAMHLRGDFTTFLTDEFYSWYDERGHIAEKRFGTEIMDDRHIFEGRRYRSVLELRNVKNRFLLETLPSQVENHVVINYDELRESPAPVLRAMFERHGIAAQVGDDVGQQDAKRGGAYQKRNYEIGPEHLRIINDGLDWSLEERLGFRKREI